ncbi:uncharacterized protein LOC129678729 isoform X1 [Psammomys obesus]|uniref:uncharacterized protein LOC129678729 isoform X1 n=1 Tax=Psammomys obesus TaxID=48139 RepID=UPI002453604C|nr:uncharacterized protein LOC129678729 isoform X1 [Psammomys obesus]
MTCCDPWASLPPALAPNLFRPLSRPFLLAAVPFTRTLPLSAPPRLELAGKQCRDCVSACAGRHTLFNHKENVESCLGPQACPCLAVKGLALGVWLLQVCVLSVQKAWIPVESRAGNVCVVGVARLCFRDREMESYGAWASLEFTVRGWIGVPDCPPSAEFWALLTWENRLQKVGRCHVPQCWSRPCTKCRKPLHSHIGDVCLCVPGASCPQWPLVPAVLNGHCCLCRRQRSVALARAGAAMPAAERTVTTRAKTAGALIGCPERPYKVAQHVGGRVLRSPGSSSAGCPTHGDGIFQRGCLGGPEGL